MYPISELAKLDLAKRGLKMDPDDLFNPNKKCLVDGICKVNGCTGSFVSSQGLIITNHHCAYRAIQSASTPARDLLQDGFSAKNQRMEIPAKGYTVRITESYQDVSPRVLSVVREEMTFVERTEAIEKRCKELEKEAEGKHSGQRAEVAEMFAGKTYVLFLYTYLTDIRLVFCPPASVGAFGGDIDNWEWPRHSGDFSFMRAYVAPDGSSADFDLNNVPYRPKRHIQVAPQGVNEEDFVFLLGYPGRTARHKTAAFLRYEEQVRLPHIAELYSWQIATMDEAGKNDRAVALKHTSRSRSLANVEKRSRGQLKGLQRAQIVAHRAAEEEKLQEFIMNDPARREKYGLLLNDIAAVYAEMTQKAPLEFHVEHLRSACRTLSFAFLIYDSAVERQKDDLERETAYMDRNFDQTVQRLILSHQDLHLPTDRIILTGMLQRLANVPEARQLKPLADVLTNRDRIPAFVDHLYQATQLDSKAFLTDALNKTPAELAASNDPFLQLIVALYPTYCELRERGKARDGRLGQLYGSLIEVKKAFLKRDFVPDANATLRMTLGHIRGYSPEDAVYKSPITTLKGVVDKTTGEAPFITPQRILDLYKAKQFGRFAHQTLGQVPVAILYDTDTTGGNSGSPIFNAQGQLVGVNFDRAYEATINDFAWNQSYSRSIGVDIRYVLWVTGEAYQAKHLLVEMGVH